jgi:hypothetical protein
MSEGGGEGATVDVNVKDKCLIRKHKRCLGRFTTDVAYADLLRGIRQVSPWGHVSAVRVVAREIVRICVGQTIGCSAAPRQAHARDIHHNGDSTSSRGSPQYAVVRGRAAQPGQGVHDRAKLLLDPIFARVVRCGDSQPPNWGHMKGLDDHKEFDRWIVGKTFWSPKSAYRRRGNT